MLRSLLYSLDCFITGTTELWGIFFHSVHPLNQERPRSQRSSLRIKHLSASLWDSAISLCFIINVGFVKVECQDRIYDLGQRNVYCLFVLFCGHLLLALRTSFSWIGNNAFVPNHDERWYTLSAQTT